MTPAPAGRLELILGPMFSGKTTELLRRLRRHAVAGRRVALVKSSKDVRYDAEGVAVVTHDGLARAAVARVAALREADAALDAAGAEVVGVDEGNFFGDLPEWCDAQAERGRVVVVAALDGTYERRPFGRVLELVPLAEAVDRLAAVCARCGRDAPFTRRRVPVRPGEGAELVGGAEAYDAVCRACRARGGEETHRPEP